MNDLVVNGFDYSVIDEICRDDVRDAAVRIKVRMARTASDIIDIGRDLIAVKEALPHGQFLPWIDAEFGMTDRTALNFTRVAERFSAKSETISDLTPTVLYALAAPSTSDEIVEEVTERAANGETFTASDIKAMKDEWNAEKCELKAKIEETKLKANKADAIKQDYEQQLSDLSDKLSKARDSNDTLKHELAQAKASTVAALPHAAKPDRSVIMDQANAIISAYNRACPEAREIAMEQIDSPVFDRTAAAR